MSRMLTVLFCLLALGGLSFTLTAPRERLYKNLKVLPKDITKPQMDSVMRSFTAALGVKCDFCHARNNDEKKTINFASDENEHKGIARDMMKMTATINKKFFDVRDAKSLQADLEVTCYTCHRGKAHPAKLPEAPKQ